MVSSVLEYFCLWCHQLGLNTEQVWKWFEFGRVEFCVLLYLHACFRLEAPCYIYGYKHTPLTEMSVVESQVPFWRGRRMCEKNTIFLALLQFQSKSNATTEEYSNNSGFHPEYFAAHCSSLRSLKWSDFYQPGKADSHRAIDETKWDMFERKESEGKWNSFSVNERKIRQTW